MRKPIAMAIMLVAMAAYIVLLASASGWINSLPRLLQLLVYVVAGVAWVFPLRPLMRWMNAEPDDEAS